MRPSSSNLINHVKDTEHLTDKDFADLINKSFIEPMTTYNLTLFERISDDPLEVNMNLTNTSSVLKKLKCLKTYKAPGPDDIPNWILRDYAEILAPPISVLLNSSYKQTSRNISLQQCCRQLILFNLEASLDHLRRKL